VAVHSAKDLPSVTPDGLVICCVPERADRRDALVGAKLDDLPIGARVATGSARRRAQLAWLRPDLTFVDLRGNMERRIAKSKEVGAGVVALAAMERLDMTSSIAQVLDPTLMLPQVAQGALALECRVEDEWVLAVLGAIDDLRSHTEVRAERSFLAGIGGGCSLPVGASATFEGGLVELDALIASLDGRVLLRHRFEGTDPVGVGTHAAEYLLASGGNSLELW
jgi:hydroxymethylbilane synthase